MKARISHAKILIVMMLSLCSLPVYSGGEYFDIEPIKLPARDSEYLRQFISMDVTDDGKVDVLELTQDERGFAVQLVQHVVGDELLLGWPILPEWNESLTAFSVIDSPEPVLALLGNGTVDFENRQALDIYHGIDLSEHLRIDLSEEGSMIEPFDAMTLIKYNSIEDFTFAVSDESNIVIYDQNYEQPISSFTYTDNITFLDGIFFTSFLDENLSVLDENGQLSILDLSDGSTLWQSALQISKYKVGNFDGDFNQEILAYSDTLQSLYLFDASQNTPIWTYSGSALSDFVLSDVNSDGTNEIYVIDSSGLISNLSHNGQIIGPSYQTQNINSYISLMHHGELLASAILTENEVIKIDLSVGLDYYSRQQKSFEKYIAADLNQNGTDKLIAIGRTTLDIDTNFLIEVIEFDEKLESLTFQTDYLDFEFDRYDIPIEIGQFDEDENLEIATIYYNGEDDFFTWANEIKIYDGLTFELEKSISISAFNMWGIAFQLVAADSDYDDIDEIYIVYDTKSSPFDFEILEVNPSTSEVTWDSDLVLGIDFSGVSNGRFVGANVDDDPGEELVIHYTWKLRVLDLSKKFLQFDLTRLFSHFVFQTYELSNTLFSMSSDSIEPHDMNTGETGERIYFNVSGLRYIKKIPQNSYIIFDQSRVYVYNKSLDEVTFESIPTSHSKATIFSPYIVNSTINNNVFYMGNSFGYWKAELKIVDKVFNSGFELLSE